MVAGTDTKKNEYDIEILTETVPKRDRHGKEWEAEQPVGKVTPVVLITSPLAFSPEHERRFRLSLKGMHLGRERMMPVKRHDRDGKLYFEVGFEDASMEQAIKDAIEVLRGLGITAKRSREFSPFMSRGEW